MEQPLPDKLLEYIYVVSVGDMELKDVPAEWRDKVAILLHR